MNDFVPIIDLESWFAGEARAQRELAQVVHRTCRDSGFMYLRNHGISQELIDETFRQARRFFALSDEEKQEVHYEKSGRHRGYIPNGAESSDPGAKADLKEAFDYGLQLPGDERMSAPNLLPPRLTGFSDGVESYFAAMIGLAKNFIPGLRSGLRTPG